MYKKFVNSTINKLSIFPRIIGDVIANVVCERIQGLITYTKDNSDHFVENLAEVHASAFVEKYQEIFNSSKEDIKVFVEQISESAATYIDEKISYDNVNPLFYRLKLTNNYQPFQKPEKIRIAFLFQSASLWISWRSLWQAISNDQRFKAYVVLAPFLSHPHIELSFYEQAKSLLNDEGISFITADCFCPNVFKPHVVFYQTPYSNSVPSYLSPRAFLKIGALIAYVPYGLDIGGGALNINSQFNAPLHQIAWRIFVRSERHKRMFAKYCRSGSCHVAVSGHPKLDMIQDLESFPVNQNFKDKIAKRTVVLWCPHFSVGEPPAWSTFIDYVFEILTEMEKREDLFLLVRPHPLLFSTLLKRIWNKEQEEDFRLRIEKTQNIILDELSDYRHAFSVADALMTDAGSFLLEFFATGKPVLYLEKYDGYGLNDDIEVIKHLYIAKSTKEVLSFLDMIQRGEDYMADERRKAIPRFLFGLDGCNGERIRDHIFDAIAVGDIGSPTPIPASEKHQDATKFWEVSSNTYLAEPEYYDIQEKQLQELLDPLKPFGRVIDIGCGDGRFTILLKEYAEYVKGIDVSPTLIEKAKTTASMHPDSERFEFSVESLENPFSCGTYDLVSCMGVTSGLIDNTLFLHAIEMLYAMVRPEGFLLLKETLSLEVDRIVEMNGYIARYRYIEAYLNVFQFHGMKLVRNIELAKDDTKHLVNRLIIFKRVRK